MNGWCGAAGIYIPGTYVAHISLFVLVYQRLEVKPRIQGIVREKAPVFRGRNLKLSTPEEYSSRWDEDGIPRFRTLERKTLMSPV
jgi:hypothetical protein